MTDLKQLLNQGDPLRDDEGLSPVNAERMRRVIVSAALESAPARTPWLRPFSIAAVGALLVVVGAMTGHRLIVEPEAVPIATAPSAPGSSGGAADSERRQLQFSTPGGTRIIWIFDENLRLQESMP